MATDRHFRLALASLAVIAGTQSVAFAQDFRPFSRLRATTIPQPTQAVARPTTLLDVVAASHRNTVEDILKNPTITAKFTEESFEAHANVYDFMLEHPDRVSLAWQRLKVPCVDITALGNGDFFWQDENGSEISWRSVGKFQDGMIWYASGKVKPGSVLPAVPVKAVAVLRCPRTPANLKTGGSQFTPSVQLYMQSDSRVATAMLRMMGPTVPKLAEDGAEQLLFYFSGVSRYLFKKPEQVKTLLAEKGR